MADTILEKIARTKRREVVAAKRRRPLARLREEAERAPPPRDFYGAIAEGRNIRLIAEIKKASPSAGLIRPDFDPARIARSFLAAGASALSVLTDRTYFQGDLSFLGDVKHAVSLPVLRKDFIVDDYQVYESRAAGADAVLLIAALLDTAQVRDWAGLAFELEMTSLIEVHDEKELDAAADCIGPERRTLLGINNRDLAVQQTDLETTHRLARRIPPGTPFITESGIRSRKDVLALERSGASAMLIGEALMRAQDPGNMARELLGR